MSDNIDNNNTLAIPEDDNGGWADDERPTGPLAVRLKGPRSETLENYPNGHFVQKETEVSWAEMVIVPIAIRKTKQYQTKYAQGQISKLLCKSLDRKMPDLSDGRFKTPVADNCAQCPKGQLAWANYDAESRTGIPDNPCENGIEMFFARVPKTDEEDQTFKVYAYYAYGKQGKALEAAYNSFLDWVQKKAGNGPKPPVYEFQFKLTSEKDPKGKSYIPKVTNITRMMDKELVAEFRAIYLDYQASRKQYQTQRANRTLTASTNAALLSSGEAEPVAAQPMTKPEYLPPVTRRKPGTPPVYVPPTEETAPAATDEPEGGFQPV